MKDLKQGVAVQNMTSTNGNKVANQFIIDTATKDGSYITFQSYEATICKYYIFSNKLILNDNIWDYSNTTRKYFKQFIDEHTPFTYETKKQFEELIKSSDNIEVL